MGSDDDSIKQMSPSEVASRVRELAKGLRGTGALEESLRGSGHTKTGGVKGQAGMTQFGADVTPRPAPPSAPVSQYAARDGKDSKKR